MEIEKEVELFGDGNESAVGFGVNERAAL